MHTSPPHPAVAAPHPNPPSAQPPTPAPAARGSFNRKALAGVLALGMIVLAADRLVLRADLRVSTASAAESADATLVSDQPGSPAESPDPGNSLANRLREAAAANLLDPSQVDDAFTASWTVPTPAPEVAPEAAPLPDAAEFVKSARVDSIVLYPDSALVVVSGEPLRVGDSFRGWTLQRVEARTLTFEREGTLAALQME